MARKLIFALSLVAAVAIVAGCKEDSNTSMKFDPKGAYENQQKYKQGAGAGTATDTTTTKE